MALGVPLCAAFALDDGHGRGRQMPSQPIGLPAVTRYYSLARKRGQARAKTRNFPHANSAPAPATS